MAKRRNENGQMRREEYEAADDDVSADSFEIGFQRASDESIRKRKIVKARVGSRPPVAKPKAAATEDDAAKSNPFGGFQGLTAAKPAASSNPFAGFSGLTGAAKPAAEVTTVASSGSSAAASGSYQQAIEGLNKEFLAFVNSQAQKNPSASWVGAVQDYLKYASEIATKHASTKPVAINETKLAAPAPFSFGTTPAPAAPPSSSFSFAAKKADEPAKPPATSGFSFGAASKKNDEAAKTSSGGFSFGGSAKKDDEPTKSPAKAATGGFSFSGGGSSLFSSKSSDTEEKTTPAFSFGGLPRPAASATSSTPATGGFSFGNLTAPKSAAPAPTGGFSFGASAPAATSASTAAAVEDEENIGREEATVIIKADSPDDDCTFEADKAKIFEFKKDEKRWADKGVHPLKVLVSQETKSARILVRNEIGKIVLNSALYKGMAIRPHEAKGKKTGVTLALQVEGGEMTQFLLKVNAARVDELIKALETAAGSS
ncbi:hypothetical protein F444_16124 [Phytophthora nicotianae P1976]|uniref:RanBD1 domain-containing protein n=1 Tax=Phytophthora nicotianae P1976 TaxID=1317066 RepID=A0A080ZJK2_PHYNI|nr:hypothetical protein F444_16124 [Phytophthora nicotianae P1976]